MVAGGTSVTATANDSDSISSKMQFEAWKDKQQDRLERLEKPPTSKSVYLKSSHVHVLQ